MREKFENGWSLSQVAVPSNNVVDRRKLRWSVSYVVTAAGTADALHLHFFPADRHSVLCCFEVPEAFVNIVERQVNRFSGHNV